jgi:hypothetical protein
MQAVFINRLIILFAGLGMVISGLLWCRTPQAMHFLHRHRVRCGGALALRSLLGHPNRRLWLPLFRLAAVACALTLAIP